MSFRWWGSSVLEHQQLLNITLYAFMLQDELDNRDSSANEESSSSSSVTTSSGISWDSSLEDESCGSSKWALQDELETVIEAIAEVYNGIEESTIEWQGKGVIVEDLSEDDAIFHFRFRKKHLQDMMDKLWPHLQPYFNAKGKKSGIIFDDGRYCFPDETLFLMVLFCFLRPTKSKRKWRATLEYGNPRFLRGFIQWSMHCKTWPWNTLIIHPFFMVKCRTTLSTFMPIVAFSRQHGASLMEPEKDLLPVAVSKTQMAPRDSVSVSLHARWDVYLYVWPNNRQ